MVHLTIAAVLCCIQFGTGALNDADVAIKALRGSIHQANSDWFTWESLSELMVPNNIQGGMQANLVLMRDDKINHKIVLQQSGSFQNGWYFPRNENDGIWYRLPSNTDFNLLTGDLRTIFDNYIENNYINRGNIHKNWNQNGLQNDAEQAGMRIFREQGLFKKDEDQILFMAIGCTSCNTCSEELKNLADEYPKLRFAFQFNNIYRVNVGFGNFLQNYRTRVYKPNISGQTMWFSLCTFLNDIRKRSDVYKFDEQINPIACHGTT